MRLGCREGSSANTWFLFMRPPPQEFVDRLQQRFAGYHFHDEIHFPFVAFVGEGWTPIDTVTCAGMDHTRPIDVIGIDLRKVGVGVDLDTELQ